jgi:PhzF family phenazine biosynthesis protein
MLITVVDAFTREPFRGNPAATVRLSAFPDDARMQAIAREMNLSETAFAVPLAPNRFRLRWFTPTREVPMCGHATLAMAHSLHDMGDVDPAQPLVFETLSGELTVRLDGGDLEMDFPAMFPVPDGQAAVVRTILGDRPHEYLGCVPMNATVVLNSQREVARFMPDLPLIATLTAAGFCITAPADPGRDYDFVARFFAPQSGIDEDPVTGSAYCTLAPYWAKRLDRLTLRARQLSARGGELTVFHAGDRVLLWGQAVTTMRGHIVA